MTKPEIEKQENGTETNASDEGAPEEPTDEKLTFVDGKDNTDMASKLVKSVEFHFSSLCA